MEHVKGNELLAAVLKQVSLHYKIEGAELLGFKKRKVLLERLKEAAPAAYDITNELIETQLRVDRILADKEKEQKNPEVWKNELEAANKKRAAAGDAAEQFFKEQGVPMNGLVLKPEL